MGSRKVNRESCQGGIIVTIVGARGLRKADVFGHSDPYCECWVPRKPHMAFRTPVVSNTACPSWSHEYHLSEWERDDPLVFRIYDHDIIGTHEKLGDARIDPQNFVPDGFDGELQLLDSGEGIVAMLRIRVELLVKVLPFGKIDPAIQIHDEPCP